MYVHTKLGRITHLIMTNSGVCSKYTDRTMAYLQDYEVTGLREAHTHLTAVPLL